MMMCRNPREDPMNPQLKAALDAGAAEAIAQELRGETASFAFRKGVQVFFLALPGGTARELLARKLPYHNWQAAFAAEISLIDDANLLAGR